MMTRDELRWLADATLHAGAIERAETDAKRFARAVIAMLPVVEWAERWRDETCSRMSGCDPCDGSHDHECEVSRNEREGCELVVAYRKAMEEW